MTDTIFYGQLTSRNHGLLSGGEQDKIKNACVAIAGAGGIGGLLAERLIRIGVGRLKISDPGLFEPTNFNRQFGSNVHTAEKNKAEVVCRELALINPEAALVCDKKGIHCQQDADELVSGASVVVDEMDFPLLKQSVYLQRAARRNNICYLFSAAIGFGATVTVFEPSGCSLEEYNGMERDVNLDLQDKPPISLERMITKIPSYIMERADIQTLKNIVEGGKPLPTTSVGVGLASILTANEVVNILIEKKSPILAPRYIHLDLLDRNYSIVQNG